MTKGPIIPSSGKFSRLRFPGDRLLPRGQGGDTRERTRASTVELRCERRLGVDPGVTAVSRVISERQSELRTRHEGEIDRRCSEDDGGRHTEERKGERTRIVVEFLHLYA